MADFRELEKRYEKIPNELKTLSRWVCFKETIRNGKTQKLPLNPNKYDSGFLGAESSNPSTWGSFEQALRFCAQYDLDGIGIELADSGLVAFDISNKQKNVPEADFREMADDFVRALNSYSEWSMSKNGIHVICQGSIPDGTRGNGVVEIYDGRSFVVVTGDAIGNRRVREATDEIEALWNKYLNPNIVKSPRKSDAVSPVDLGSSTDDEVLETAFSSKYGGKIKRLLSGDHSDYPDRESAIKGLCSFLAYYSMGDAEQVDRIFRSSKLFDASWDAPEDNKTHGYFVVLGACEAAAAFHVEAKPNIKMDTTPELDPESNLDEYGEPIFRISPDYRPNDPKYTLDDTGNAKRFNDCFGHHFHWNTKMRVFMFWTGKTWIYDSKDYIRKYANRMLDILGEQARQLKDEISEIADEERRKRMERHYDAFAKNIKHLSNRAGKDAMLAEFRSLGNVPADPTEFNKDILSLNTASGIVDLNTGEILPFDRNAMFSSNTNVEVSFDEPKVWLRFLDDIFEGNQEVIECYQRCIGYTLTGLTSEQIMFILYGDGSNGKSTQSGVMQGIMGDYYGAIDPSQLMTKDAGNAVAVQNSLAEHIDTRYLITQETEKGARLSESVVKKITGSTPVNAQKKFGDPFKYMPKFKVWMETNNLPYITGNDYGIWRRIFLFPFNRQFKDEEKDKDLPEKLKAEYPKILGWAIQGAVKYLRDGKDLKQPECLRSEIDKYKEKNDGIARFIKDECHKNPSSAVTKSDMYKAYRQWAMDNKEHTYPETKFRDAMKQKGFPTEVDPISQIAKYVGVSLNDNTMAGPASGRRYGKFEEDD